jgi:D-lactate dehydrogenase
MFVCCCVDKNNACSRSKEHVIIIQNDDFNGSRARLRKRLDEFVQSAPADSIVLHECKTPDEIRRIKNFRFAAAPAFRTFCIGKRLHGVSFDFALPKNYEHSVILEPEGEEMEVKMMYGHFGCAVYHYDVAIKGGEREAASLKKGMVNAVEQVGGKLPAEHGFGTEYTAPPGTVARWKEVDPTNMFNPGVGKTTNLPNWKE